MNKGWSHFDARSPELSRKYIEARAYIDVNTCIMITYIHVATFLGNFSGMHFENLKIHVAQIRILVIC